MTEMKPIQEMGLEELTANIVSMEFAVHYCQTIRYAVLDAVLQSLHECPEVTAKVMSFMERLEGDYRERMTEFELGQARCERQILQFGEQRQ